MSSNAELESRLATLELRLARVEGEHASLLKTFGTLAADREKLGVDLDLNVAFLTQRLEALKARPAGDGDADDPELVAAIEDASRGMLELLKLQNATDEKLRWLTRIVLRNMEGQAKALGIAV